MEDNMKKILKEIITEFHHNAIPKPLPRNIAPFSREVRKAWVYIGMRRSGKTWSMYQLMHELMNQGINQTQLLYLNFEDDRLNGMSIDDFQSILDVYWELQPEGIHDQNVYFFFDEIAEVEGWERFIRRLLDKEQMQIILSGSSAKLLSKEIATGLRGRTLTREIFPMSFEESLSIKEISTPRNPTKKDIALLQRNAEYYLKWGGFPEVLNADPALHREILQGYIDSVIYRDIIERYNIKNHNVLRQLLFHCLQNPATLMSINKTYQQFKTRGLKVSRETLYQFMEYFQDAYCLFSVSVYSFSLNKAELKPKKIYPTDMGLITAYSIKPGFNQAALLETAVFIHLRRTHQDIYYFQTAQGQEVDFLTLLPNGKMSLYQASVSVKNEKTRMREVSALTQAMTELQITNGAIVTVDESDELTLDGNTIHIIPLWKFYVS
jgi:uncharacterized protein